MDNIAFKASSVLLDILKANYQNDYSSIKEVKLFWHNLNYLLVSKINCLMLSEKNQNVILDDFCDLKLIPQSLMTFYCDNYNLICEPLDKLSRKIYNDGVSVELFREQLLSIELNIEKNSISLNQGKVSRDTTGSYYTPNELAKAIVEKTFSDQKIKDIILNGRNELKILDASCGGGEFLCATQEYLFKNYGISYEECSTYFWGIDVDPIILQITICRLLLKSKRTDWGTIISHFYFGNPLIATESEASFDRKNELFALNRIYSNEIGLDFSKSEISDFDIILGNPPWEKIRFEERKFFNNYCQNVSRLSKKDERAKEINKLKGVWNELYQWSLEILNDYKSINSQSFNHPLIKESVSGELNTYCLFTELCYRLLKPSGISTLIVKNTLATAPAHKKFWGYLLENGAIKSLYFYDNKKRIFPIDTRERFAIISLSRINRDSFVFSTGLEQAYDILSCEELFVSDEDIIKINPFTNMLPNVSKNDDFKFLIETHERLPLFKDVYSNCHFGRLVHLTAHSEYISKRAKKGYLPIFEGKFIEQYDARFSTFANMPDSMKYAAKASAKKTETINGKKPIPESRYFIQADFWEKLSNQYIEEFLLCWRSLTSPTNRRTTLAMLLPMCPTCQSVQLLQTNRNDMILLLGLFNSLIFDYFVRMKMPGLDLTQSVINQIPVPKDEVYRETTVFNGRKEELITHIFSCIYFLISDEDLLNPLLKGMENMVYKIDNNQSKDSVKKTLDDIFAYAYHIDSEMYKKIIDSFPKY